MMEDKGQVIARVCRGGSLIPAWLVYAYGLVRERVVDASKDGKGRRSLVVNTGGALTVELG